MIYHLNTVFPEGETLFHSTKVEVTWLIHLAFHLNEDVTPRQADVLFLFFTSSPCWYEDLHFNWMYKLPCILSVFANLFFLCWIVFVLVSKFHADISDRASMVKTARAIGKYLYLRFCTQRKHEFCYFSAFGSAVWLTSLCRSIQT